MRKLANITLILLTFFTTLVVLLCLTYNYYISSVDKNNGKLIEVEIKKGSSSTSISKLLKGKGLIKSDLIFKVYSKLNGVSNYKAGFYQLSKNMNVKKISEILVEGSTYNPNEVIITFNEGINMRKIADIIAKNTVNTKDDVYSLLRDKEYINSLIKKYWFLSDSVNNLNIYYSLEGYLYPNTYKFNNKKISVKTIFETMLNEMNKILSKNKEEIENSKYSVHELLTIASIAELEGVSESDRAGITNVFYNRLNKSMSLGSDVTTYYAQKVDMAERDLTYSEFNEYNLYNTRGPKMEGKLPIGPICSPSKEAIEAAIFPATSNNYYFVADKNRKVYFTKTITEHEAIIAKLKKEGLWFTW